MDHAEENERTTPSGLPNAIIILDIYTLWFRYYN
jgi:hypothetical protein